MQEVATSAATTLLQYGILGVFVLAFAFVIFVLWRENAKAAASYIADIKAAHEQRVADVRAVHAELMEQNRASTEALTSAAEAIERNTSTMLSVQSALGTVTDEMRTQRRKG